MPMVVAPLLGEPGDALCVGIGMTINLPGHPISVTYHYFNHTTLFGLSTNLHRFQVIE